MERNWMKADWKRGLFGAAVGIVMMLALTGCGAWLLSAGILDVAWMNYLAAGILLVSAFVGVTAGGSDTVNGLISAGVFWTVLLAINAVMFDCALPGIWAVLAAVLGGGGAGMLVRIAPRGKRHRRRGKYRHR